MPWIILKRSTGLDTTLIHCKNYTEFTRRIHRVSQRKIKTWKKSFNI
jgi:hypothetical protein